MEASWFQAALSATSQCPLASAHVRPNMAVSSTSREALRLYRDLLKSCKKFNWTNDDGLPWYELLSRF